MSNRAEVILRGARHPQVGRICMDQIMVNIEWGTAYNGDEVVLIGEQDGERMTVEELAELGRHDPLRDPDLDQRPRPARVRGVAPPPTPRSGLDPSPR